MKIGRKLNEKGASYHTCQLQQQRAYKVFIRFLHSSNLPAEVKEAIEKHEHQVRNVVNVRHSESKVPLPPLLFVDLESNQNNKDICKLDRLLNAKIQIELPKKKHTIVQCIRFQRYRRTKGYCRRQHRSTVPSCFVVVSRGACLILLQLECCMTKCCNRWFGTI